jgi:hypothetical protein
MALLQYKAVNGAFPPAVFTDDHGKPMKSWRVAILPYLEEQALYQRYDSKQPWNAPQNHAVASTPVSVALFCCPSDPDTTANPTETNYVMVVGKKTVGGMPNEVVKSADTMDTPGKTILLVEVSGLHINWTEPRDVTVEEFMEMVAKGRASHHPGGFQVLTTDGSAHFLSNGIDPKTLRAMLLRNHGQPVGDY